MSLIRQPAIEQARIDEIPNELLTRPTSSSTWKMNQLIPYKWQALKLMKQVFKRLYDHFRIKACRACLSIYFILDFSCKFNFGSLFKYRLVDSVENAILAGSVITFGRDFGHLGRPAYNAVQVIAPLKDVLQLWWERRQATESPLWFRCCWPLAFTVKRGIVGLIKGWCNVGWILYASVRPNRA